MQVVFWVILDLKSQMCLIFTYWWNCSQLNYVLYGFRCAFCDHVIGMDGINEVSNISISSGLDSCSVETRFSAGLPNKGYPFI